MVPQSWFRQDFSDAPPNELQRLIVGMIAALPQAQGLGLDATAVETVGEAAAFIRQVPDLPSANPPTPRGFWRPRRRPTRIYPPDLR